MKIKIKVNLDKINMGMLIQLIYLTLRSKDQALVVTNQIQATMALNLRL